MHCSCEAMGDDDSRLAGAQAAEALKPVGFGPGIHRARRLVENDDWSAAQKRPGERDSLPLANAQFRAAGEPFSQQIAIALRQAGDRLVGSSIAAGRSNGARY